MITTLFFIGKEGEEMESVSSIIIVPPPVHPLTYQVRPFTALLLHMRISNGEKKGKVTFLCMQKGDITQFFLLMEEKRNWCCRNEG